MGGRLIIAENSNMCGHNTMLASIRLGNVLGFRGSVLLIFREQIKIVPKTDNLTAKKDYLTPYRRYVAQFAAVKIFLQYLGSAL